VSQHSVMVRLELTDVLQFLNKIMTEVQGVQHKKVFQVFNLRYHIVLHIQATQFCLVTKVFNALNAVVLKP
jgi:hypothetical protein